MGQTTCTCSYHVWCNKYCSGFSVTICLIFQRVKKIEKIEEDYHA